jgi:uncharacterized protein (DUF433 family)
MQTPPVYPRDDELDELCEDFDVATTEDIEDAMANKQERTRNIVRYSTI